MWAFLFKNKSAFSRLDNVSINMQASILFSDKLYAVVDYNGVDRKARVTVIGSCYYIQQMCLLFADWLFLMIQTEDANDVRNTCLPLV